MWIRITLMAALLGCGSKTGLLRPHAADDDGGTRRRDGEIRDGEIRDGDLRDGMLDAGFDAPRDTLPPLPDSEFRIDGDTCRPSTELVDLLLMVDGSGSMSDERMTLGRELPRLVGALLTGDVDYGTREAGGVDFPPVQSLNVGLVSADLATGTEGSFCRGPHGQDGVIGGSMPTFINFESGDDPSRFEAQFRSVSENMGSCPIEQSAESMLKALVPSTCTDDFCVFEAGSRGQGDRANAGFLRDGSLLALVVLTDEDDCSAEDPLLFLTDFERTPEYSRVTLNLRCSLFPDALTRTDRYVRGFQELVGDPRQLVFALVGGFPPGLGSLDGTLDYGAVLARDEMQIARDPENISRVLPACEGTGGPATPGRRLLQIAQSLEENGTPTVAQSICEPEYDGLINGVMRRIAERALETCE